MKNTPSQIVRRICKNKNGVITVVIPRQFARELDLENPTDVIIQRSSEFLLIKKLEGFY